MNIPRVRQRSTELTLLTFSFQPDKAKEPFSMSEYQTVAKVGDIPAGEGRAFPVGGNLVAVFNTDGEYSAIRDACPHMGASLATGYVEDGCVTCPWHAWRFSVTDGTWLDNPQSKLSNECYAVRVEGDEIQVCRPAESESNVEQTQE